MKNMVVVIEGPDGAGKTTLVQQLKEDINNKRPELKVLALSLPHKDSFGYDKIRDILKSKVDYPIDVIQSLFVINMIECADNVIKPFLNESEEDHIVLVDRSLISTIIYNETCNGTIRDSINKYMYNIDSDIEVNFDIINKIYCHFPTISYTFFLLPPSKILIKHSRERHSDEINDTESLVIEREHAYRKCYNYLSGNVDRLRGGGQSFFWWPDESTWDKYIILDRWTYDWSEEENYARNRKKVLGVLKI